MTKLFTKFLLLFIILLLNLLDVYSQSLLVKRPELLAGMQKAHINTLFEDQKGQIWAGMKEGLLMYNGVESKLYTKADSLSYNNVTAITQDKNGILWIGYQNGEISQYNGKTFKKFTPKEGTPKQKITQMIVSKNNWVWFATDSAGLWYYNGERMYNINEDDGLLNPKNNTGAEAETEEFANLIPGLESGVSLGKKKIEIYALNEDTDGKIWVGTDGGVVIIDPSKTKKARFSYISTNEGLADNIIKNIFSDASGNIWLASGDNGLWKYNKSQKSLVMTENWVHGAIKTCLFFDKKTFWISTQKSGLIIYNPHNQSTIVVQEVNKTVTSLCQDHEGNILIGTENGIFQYFGDRFEFINQTNGLSSNNVLSVHITPAGEIWAGTDMGLNRIISTPTAGFVVESIPLRGPSGKTQITSIRSDKFGKLWIATLGQGVFRVDPQTGSTSNYTNTSGLESNDVNGICLDKNGSLFFATFGGGVSKAEFSGDGVNVKIVNLKEQIPVLEGSYIYTVYSDSKNNLWIGTDGKGLLKFDGNSLTTFSEKEGVMARTILSITEDTKGGIWVGTSEYGLMQMQSNKFTSYNFQKGLRDESPHAILCDNDGNIVIGNTKGLDVLNPQTQKFSYFDESDGISGYEPQQNAIAKDAAGVIYLGTTSGILRFNPKAQFPKHVGPKVSINKLRIFLKDDVMMIPDMELAYNQNHITFDFTGISLSAPKKVKYQYKLDGYEEDFSLETQSRVQTYSNLPSGDYTFIVRASNGNGVISEAKYHFIINPPFWKRWWFLTLSTALLVFGGYSGFKWRIRRIEEEKRILEEKVAERTHELNEVNNELSVLNEEIRQTLDYVSHQNEIIEEKNKDITESIEYAKRLQYAILPEDPIIKEALPESFVYYRPKDIVSGDFYWFNKQDKKAYIAGVDCTGHGVPGAFMSIVGYNQLNESFNDPQNNTPGAILNSLDFRVRKALKQDSEFSVTKDGMDVAMACVDYESNQLIYSGAYRPLFFIRDNDIIEYKGDRYPIGGSQYEGKDFQNQIIDLKEGDIFYLFSDGYVDQFGGDKGRKFTPKKLRELLLEIHQKPMPEQCQMVEKAFIDWMGNHQQMDDVMLIGVRYVKI